MPPYVYPLEDAPAEPALVGGKAAGLGRLLRGGLPVPAGFVLTADAFRAFLRANALEGDLAAGAPGDAPGTGALDRLRAATWPDDLRSAVAQAYAALQERAQGACVAVRSSGTAEDSASASFAGQHATLLNREGLDAALDAVLGCWASLYGETAVHYRRMRGVQDDGPAMAVVVQALVPAEASGVAFTLDPVRGDRDVVLIEGAWGLGEGVVSGIVTPDHYAIRKSDGALVRREVAQQHVQIVAALEGGTREEPLSPEQARRPVLSDDQAAELARLAIRIEELMGAPQDIEWAIAGDEVFVLQARPVTAVAGGLPPPPVEVEASPEADAPPEEGWVSEFDTESDPETVWTSANVQEVLPDQISPLNLTMTEEIVQRFGMEPMHRLGLRPKVQPLFSAYFYGRPFLNVSLTVDVADQLPFGSVEAIMEQYYDIPRDLLPKRTALSPAKVWRYANVVPRFVWFRVRYTAEVRRAERIIADFEREMAERPFAQRSIEDLLRDAEDGLVRGGDVGITHVSGAGLTGSVFDMLRGLTRRWLGDETGSLQATLCSGLAGVESAQPVYELWDISRLVLASESLRAAFEPAAGAEIERRLDQLEGDEVASFRQRLREFLARHGHRSVMEADIAARSWEEDLPTVFAMVRNYLHAGDSADARRIEERQRHEREKATEEALRRLRWWQRPVFRRILSQAQQWVVLREHTKSLLVRATQRNRRLTRELGRRLAERGALEAPVDIYHLAWDEVKALAAGSLTRDDALAQVRRRREEEERNGSVKLPEFFKGRPKPLRPADLPSPDGRVLHGIAVSPGRVTGPARVILDPRQDAAIEPGEILVAPVTDAGWTPLFVPASGIVVDVGGTLSHGSTVAREFGLPAVVNVKHGTRLIRTGQTITVDGTQGVVLLDGVDEADR